MIRSRLRRLFDGRTPERPSGPPAAPPAAAPPPAAPAAPQAPAPPAPAAPAPSAPAPAPAAPQPPPGRTAPAAPPAGPAPLSALCDRFAMRILVLAEQQREALDGLERDEQDADRLKRLYDIDHATAQMRRAAREMRVLSDQGDDDLGGRDASLIDVVRMAAASIEAYPQVSVGSVADLSVPAYAADDVASLLAPLLDNAARYSPGPVNVSAHPLETGGAVFRITDSGIGIGEARLEALNAEFAGPVPPVDRLTDNHTGFAVVHRLARRHGVTVHLAARAAPGGTTASVSLPARLVGEAVDRPQVLGDRPGPAPGRPAPPSGPLLSPALPGPGGAPPPEPPPPPRPAAGELPRRTPRSLRADGAGTRERPPQQGGPVPDGPAAAGSFADDLEAFASGGAAPEAPKPHDPPENEVP
ncbi:sensor histidine kinase [Nocardiopsis potens]|uniref:sensor histidine kinase n=1 Tax=Nocardiopsis potens TaxID=1246458 RepID=UPI00034639AA|nr:ATP-binding protein [Nocardiopsis potens]